MHAARSTLEVKTRRRLVAHGLTDFVRELPLSWNGSTYRFDFTFQRERVVLETNGRRRRDDPRDDETTTSAGASRGATATGSSSRRGRR